MHFLFHGIHDILSACNTYINVFNEIDSVEHVASCVCMRYLALLFNSNGYWRKIDKTH